MAVKKAQLLEDIQAHLVASEMFIESNEKFSVSEGSSEHDVLTHLSDNNARLLADLLKLTNSLQWIKGNLQKFNVVGSPKLGDEVPPKFRR